MAIKNAFGEIVNRYQKMVAPHGQRYAWRFHFAEDIGQEVFINLYYSLSEFRGEAKLSTYIQKIAINLDSERDKEKEKILFSLFSAKGK